MKKDRKYMKLLAGAQLYCSKAEKCSDDVARKLKTWEASDRDIKRIILQLQAENFINNQRFAIAFANDKLRFNKWGKIKITYHLKQKKLSDVCIQNAIEQIDYEEYINILLNIIDIKKRSINARNHHELKTKILRFTYTRGFENELTLKLLNE